jgi:hypothetical protein
MAAKEMAGNKTNIVFILSDDQGIWAARCYRNVEIRMPNTATAV